MERIEEYYERLKNLGMDEASSGQAAPILEYFAKNKDIIKNITKPINQSNLWKEMTNFQIPFLYKQEEDRIQDGHCFSSYEFMRGQLGKIYLDLSNMNNGLKELSNKKLIEISELEFKLSETGHLLVKEVHQDHFYSEY